MPSNLRANGDLNNDRLYDIADLVVLGGMVEQNYDASPPGRKDKSRDMIGLGPIMCTDEAGDVNGDGSGNLADVIALLNDLFVPNSLGICESCADVNDDGGVNVADAIYYLAYLFVPGSQAQQDGLAECVMITFETTFGGANLDEGRSVQQTFDSFGNPTGYIITGGTFSFGAGSVDVYLVKTDSLGVEEWSRTFGGANPDGGYSVKQTFDGGFIITGSTGSFGSGGYDVYLVKTDENGNEEWSQTLGGANNDYGSSVQQTSDGGFIITGFTDSFGAGSLDVYLVKTDEDGNEEWSQTFGGAEWDEGYSVQQTSDGGYILTGITESFGAGSRDVYLIKTDQNGNVL
jgi:hypothetical protein